MRHQSTPRKSGARGRAVARRLLSNVDIVQSVLDATIYDEQISDAVVTFKAGRKFTLNGLVVAKASTSRWLRADLHTATTLPLMVSGPPTIRKSSRSAIERWRKRHRKKRSLRRWQ